MEEKILKTINKYNLIDKDDIVVVAVSGGPDSMALLNSLYNLREKLKIKKIVVAHVNHMLREEAEAETRYVKEFCDNKNIEIYLKYVNIKLISVNNKISEETAGREERYKFFEEVANNVNANKIAIAHNYNDNAETVLMHLIRGSGISGLCGIKPYREGKFIRPLIECERKEIEEYCNKNNLQPKYDKTNNDNTYTRNKIRNLLIPYIQKEFNPNIIESLNRMSKIILEEEEYMEEVVVKEYKTCLIDERVNKIIINLKKFNELNYAIKSREILYIVKKLFGTSSSIEKIHIDDIIKLCTRNIGNKYLTPNKNIKIFIKSGEVSFEKVLK